MQTFVFAICNWNTNLLQRCRTPFQNQQFILKEKKPQYPQLIGVFKITECFGQVYENALSFPFLCSALHVLHMPCFAFLFYSFTYSCHTPNSFLKPYSYWHVHGIPACRFCSALGVPEEFVLKDELEECLY